MSRRALRFAGLACLALFAAACPDPSNKDVTLDPPPAGAGFQIATDTFEVPAGQEVQRCYFVAVPGSGTAPIWIDHMVAALNPGSHHMNLFRVKTVHALSGKPGDVVDGGECWKSGNWADWPLVINSQESSPGKNTVDWQLPQNVAHRFTPGELLMLQIHYVNATTQQTPGRGKGLLNFYSFAGPGTPMELGTVFATNQNIKICPGDVNKTFGTTCRFTKTPVTIIGANGHFHSRGTKFTIDAIDLGNNPIASDFYTSTVWNDPPFMHDLDIQLPSGGGIGWSCTYDYAPPAHACAGTTPGMPGGDGMSTSMPNGNCAPYDGTCSDVASSCCISFGGHVEVQEHCNAFVYYYPKVDDVSCF